MSRRKPKTINLNDPSIKAIQNQVSKKNGPWKPKPISFLNKRQQTYHNAIYENQIVVATGPAGTAKTFVACAAALELLAVGDVEKIIITKPSVEIGKTQGYLPGSLEEKMEPFTASVLNCIEQIVGKEQAANLMYSKKVIEIVPLQMLRGLTLDNCIIIADEMQNSTYAQMKALLTRLGEDSVLVLNGDQEQSDLPDASGLSTAIEILQDIDEVEFVEFTIDDIVRSGIVKDIIIAYHNLEKKK